MWGHAGHEGFKRHLGEASLEAADIWGGLWFRKQVGRWRQMGHHLQRQELGLEGEVAQGESVCREKQSGPLADPWGLKPALGGEQRKRGLQRICQRNWRKARRM